MERLLVEPAVRDARYCGHPMENVIAALAGLFGAFAGAWIAVRGQHANWRKQETIKGYATFFPAAHRELEVLDSLDDGAAFGNDEWIDKALNLQPSLIDSPLLQQLNACWLYESSPGIREKLEHPEKAYRDTRKQVRRRLRLWRCERLLESEAEPSKRADLGRTIERLQDQEDTLWPSELKKHLSKLRSDVAERYFRNADFE